MPVRVIWYPPDELTPDRYEITIVEETERFLAAVAHQAPGPYWEVSPGRFSFEDPMGTDATVYRVRALGPGGSLYGDTGPFQPSASMGARLASRKRVDHDYGGTDQLRYVAPSGPGIPDATIRAFRASEWDAGRRASGEYVVMTDVLGRWKTPMWLEPGLDWVLVFEKAGSFGPDTRRVTV